MDMYDDVLLLKGEKKAFWGTEGQVLHKCFCRGEGVLQHLNVTHSSSQKPSARNSKMSEVKGKNCFQNENGTFLINCPHLIQSYWNMYS